MLRATTTTTTPKERISRRYFRTDCTVTETEVQYVPCGRTVLYKEMLVVKVKVKCSRYRPRCGTEGG